MSTQEQQQMTAAEKSALGLSLSGADISDLLKDPNSWVSKLYAECELEAAITREAFILFVEATMLEMQQAEKQEAYDKFIAAERAERQQRMDDGVSKQKEPTPIVVDLLPSFIKVDHHEQLKVATVVSLLSLPVSAMTDNQLAFHSEQLNQQLTTRLNHHVAAALGLHPSQLSTQPPVTPMEQLKVNPVLAQRLAQDGPQAQRDYVVDSQKRSDLNSTMKKFHESLPFLMEKYIPSTLPLDIPIEDISPTMAPQLRQLLLFIDKAVTTSHEQKAIQSLLNRNFETNMESVSRQLAPLALKNGQGKGVESPMPLAPKLPALKPLASLGKSPATFGQYNTPRPQPAPAVKWVKDEHGEYVVAPKSNAK